MSIKKLYSNELLASFEYSNIDKDYDFYYVTTSDKYIKGGATFLDIDDIKISALQFESGKSFWVMLPKNAISRAEFVRLLNAKEDGDSLSIKSMTSSSIPEYLLTQLFLNALTSPVDEMISFNNLSGKLLCFRPAWLNKDKENFISDSEVDPHQESMEDYVVQHITVENFKHQSSAAVYNILKELVIKKDIAIGKITLVDWSQYGYKADWLFGVVVDGTYYFMTIHPDGSFKIEALKRNLFTMTEYDKYMDYFGLNEENKNDYRGVIGLVKDAEGNINLIKDTNMYSMPDYTAMGDVLKNVASEGRFPGKDVVTWLRLVMDTTDKIKVHAELDIVIPHIDVNAEYTKANVMGLFKGITTKKEVVRYVFENTGIMLYAYLRGEEERREYLSGNIDINYFDYDDTHAKYSVGEIGNGMKYTIERASVVREIQAVEGSKLIFKKVLPLMGVEFVRYGMLTVVPFPFKYLREYIVKEEKSV